MDSPQPEGDDRRTYQRTRSGADPIRPEGAEERERFLEEELRRREEELDRIVRHYESLLEEARSDQRSRTAGRTEALADRLLPDVGRSLSPFHDE